MFNGNHAITKDQPMSINSTGNEAMKLFDDTITALLDGLDRLITGGSPHYAADLHNELFNTGEYYIYYEAAREALAEADVWECIGVVQAYEKGHFGEVYTPLSNPCRVADMCIYILGYELMHAIYSDTEYFCDKWNDDLTTDDIKEMKALAETWLDENPDGVERLWNDLDTE